MKVLTKREYQVLSYLVRNLEPVRACIISRDCGVNTQQVYTVLNRMVRKGLIGKSYLQGLAMYAITYYGSEVLSLDTRYEAAE